MATENKTEKRDLKAFMADVRKVVKNEGTLRDKYQELAMEALEHYVEHGDSSFMSGLVNEMGLKSRYRQAMLDYFKNHAPVKTEKDGKNLSTPAGKDAIKFKTKDGMKPSDTNLEAAKEMSFQDARTGGGRQTAGQVTIFDEAKQLENFLARHKRMQEGNVPERYDGAELLPEEAVNLMRRAHAVAERSRLEAKLAAMNAGEQPTIQ